MKTNTNYPLKTDEVLARIIDLLNQKNKTQRELIDYLGLANGTFTQWKYKNGKSYLNYIDKIAAFLNTTSDYLMFGIDMTINSNSLSSDEIEYLKYYRDLTPKQKQILLYVIKEVSDDNKSHQNLLS